MGRLDGKVAIITGGARGQGAAEARLFAAEGAKVVITDVLDNEGNVTAAEIGGMFIRHDVSSEAAWKDVVAKVLAQHGRIDVLVNNAGIFRRGTLLTTSLADYQQMLNVNQIGVFLGMQAVAPTMVQQKSGSIVNISSIAGFLGAAGAFAYGASKWAVRGMSKAAGIELAKHGVRVNSIHPGMIDTDMMTEVTGGDDERRAKIARSVPNGRQADPIEVAKVALFLASDDASYCNATEFVVDAGRHRHLKEFEHMDVWKNGGRHAEGVPPRPAWAQRARRLWLTAALLWPLAASIWPCAAATAPAVTPLAPEVQARLAAREYHTALARESILVVPARYAGDERLLRRMAGLGHANADTFDVPMIAAGTVVRVVRFEPQGDDARGEAMALFQQLVGLFPGSVGQFVAFLPSVMRPRETAARYEWLFWRTPSGGWVLLDAEPRAYFEAKLAAEKAQPNGDRTLLVAYLVQLAQMQFVRDRPRVGTELMREALQYIDTAPPGAVIPPLLQLRVLAPLVSQAAKADDDEALGSLIQRYALLARTNGVALPSTPLHFVAPAVRSGTGCVMLSLAVLPDGRVEHATVAGSTAPDSVAHAVQRAATQWRFLPAVEGGVTVKSSRDYQFCTSRDLMVQE